MFVGNTSSLEEKKQKILEEQKIYNTQLSSHKQQFQLELSKDSPNSVEINKYAKQYLSTLSSKCSSESISGHLNDLKLMQENQYQLIDQLNQKQKDVTTELALLKGQVDNSFSRIKTENNNMFLFTNKRRQSEQNIEKLNRQLLMNKKSIYSIEQYISKISEKKIQLEQDKSQQKQKVYSLICDLSSAKSKEERIKNEIERKNKSMNPIQRQINELKDKLYHENLRLQNVRIQIYSTLIRKDNAINERESKATIGFRKAIFGAILGVTGAFLTGVVSLLFSGAGILTQMSSISNITDIEGLDEQISNLKNQENILNESKQPFEQSIALKEKKLQKYIIEQNPMKIYIMELQSIRDTIGRDMIHIMNNIQALEKKIVEKSQQINQKQRELDSLFKEKEKLTNELKQKYSELINQQNELKDFDSRIDKIKISIQINQNKIETLTKQFVQKDELLEIDQIRLKVQQSTEELNNLINSLKIIKSQFNSIKNRSSAILQNLEIDGLDQRMIDKMKILFQSVDSAYQLTNSSFNKKSLLSLNQ